MTEIAADRSGEFAAGEEFVSCEPFLFETPRLYGVDCRLSLPLLYGGGAFFFLFYAKALGLGALFGCLGSAVSVPVLFYLMYRVLRGSLPRTMYWIAFLFRDLRGGRLLRRRALPVREVRW